MKKLITILILGICLISLTSANRIYFNKGCWDCRDYAKFIKEVYQNNEPFNSVRWSISSETFQEPEKGDVIISFQNINYAGWSWEGNIIFNNKELDKRWEFLVLHESGHAFGLAHDEDYGITSNFSIMSRYGGDSQFRDWQIKIIQENLQ